MSSFIRPACLSVSVPERLAIAVAKSPLCASHHFSKKLEFLCYKTGTLIVSEMPCGELGGQLLFRRQPRKNGYEATGRVPGPKKGPNKQ